MKYLSCKAESSILTSNSHSSTKSNSKNEQHTTTTTDSSPLPPIPIKQFHYKDLETATNGFSPQTLLGKGSHGCVYKALLSNGRLVAVKKPSSPTTTTTEIENEIHILSKIRSPGFVNLIGFSTTNTNTNSRSRLLVVEYMSNGTLYELLHSGTRSPPSWFRRIRLSLQTAKAIHTLHSHYPPLIHRDIKSANVLIDKKFNARLGDFGLAVQCHMQNYRYKSTPPAGTIGYLDPGYLTPDNLSTKIDVFSFGILLLEIISGRKAIDIGYSPPSILDWAVPLIRTGNYVAVYDPRIAPPKDLLVRKQLAVLAAKCVRSSWERRPTMTQVVDTLAGLSKMVPGGQSWNSFSITNPCVMVDEVVCQQVECGNNRIPQGRSCGDTRNARRVYSDLGMGGGKKSNLMDLMAEADGPTVDRVFSLRRNYSLG